MKAKHILLYVHGLAFHLSSQEKGSKGKFPVCHLLAHMAPLYRTKTYWQALFTIFTVFAAKHYLPPCTPSFLAQLGANTQPNLNMFTSYSWSPSHSERQSHTAEGCIWVLVQVHIDLHASDISPRPKPQTALHTEYTNSTQSILREHNLRETVSVWVCVCQRRGTQYSTQSSEQSPPLAHNKFLCACKGHLWCALWLQPLYAWTSHSTL